MLITQYWDAPTIPEEISALMASYDEQNPDAEHLCFDRNRAAAFIAQHFTAREVAAFNACAVPSMQADYFRHCAVFVHGGFYVDVDTQCVKPLAPLLADDLNGVVFHKMPHDVIVGGFFGFTHPGHPFLRLAIDLTTLNIERRVSDSVWTVTGPAIFTAVHYALMPANDLLDVAAYTDDLELRAVIANAREAIAASGFDREAVMRGVSVLPDDMRFLYTIDAPAAYKSTTDHWLHWPGSIYAIGPCEWRRVPAEAGLRRAVLFAGVLPGRARRATSGRCGEGRASAVHRS